MRTKTLLLAASVIAAGIASSEAQSNVYSQNIVGYVTYISTTASPQYELICNPLDNGPSNNLASLFPASSAPGGGSTITLWTGSSYGIEATFAGGKWKTNGVDASGLVVPPGEGLFVQWANHPYTNVFIGNVDPAVGVTATNVIPAGYQMIASEVPYNDSVTNTATVNLTGVAGGTTLTVWDTADQSFDLEYTFAGGHWKLGGVSTNIILNVPQGFFLNSSTPYNWIQTGP